MNIFYERYKFDRRIKSDIKKIIDTDNYHGILSIIQNYLIILLTIYCVLKSHYILYPLGLLVIGSRQRALATILHESAHNTLASNRILSLLLGTFCSGYLVFSTFSVYKYSHVRLHHRHFADPEKDDDYKYMLSKKVYALCSPKSYIWRLFLAPCIILTVPSHILFLIKSRCYNKAVPNSKLEVLLLLSYWSIIGLFIYKLGIFWQFILFWIIPYLTTCQLINWFIELSEHAPLMKNHCDIEMSRNRNSHWIEKFFTGMHNENYHLAHHLWPNVPYWNVKKLHQILMRDSVYAKIHNECGGIFISSNNAATVMSSLKKYILEEHNKSINKENEICS